MRGFSHLVHFLPSEPWFVWFSESSRAEPRAKVMREGALTQPWQPRVYWWNWGFGRPVCQWETHDRTICSTRLATRLLNLQLAPFTVSDLLGQSPVFTLLETRSQNQSLTGQGCSAQSVWKEFLMNTEIPCRGCGGWWWAAAHFSPSTCRHSTDQVGPKGRFKDNNISGLINSQATKRWFNIRQWRYTIFASAVYLWNV